jgi:hypothetical protein
MTSAINTNGINVNYPVPGVNNNSQGFRDNFTAIRTNLNTTATELTDLQNKVVVKQALDGTVINNDMANAVISNAVTRSFRASTYNLGNALSGTVLVDVTLGDVQYGTIAGNTILSFGGWAPSGTQSSLELVLGFSNAQAVLSFPTNVINTVDYGSTTIENYSSGGNFLTLTVPYGVTQLDFNLTTLDCGNSIYIQPLNRPRQSTQIFNRTPPPTGQQGDVQGTFSIDPSQTAEPATCTATEGTFEIITCNSTAGFYLDMPIVFTGNVFGGITAGTTYYVRVISSSTTFTISASPGTVSGPSAVVNLSTASGTMIATPVQYLYASTGNYDGTVVSKTATNTTASSNTQAVTSVASTGNLITVTSTANYALNDPIVFSGSNTAQNSFITFNLANTIQVSSVADFTVGMPVTFENTVWESNLSQGNTFYVNTVQPTVSAGLIQTQGQYTIATAGTTNFTLLGAANNNVGTSFTATANGLYTSGNFVIGQPYTIATSGTTNFVALGSASNTAGTTFTATGTGLVSSGSFVVGESYTIVTPGTTDFTLLGASNSLANTTFTATGNGLITAGSFVTTKSYTIVSAGSTNFTLIGAANNNPGTTFVATGAGTGTGTANQGNGTAAQGTGTAVQGTGTAVASGQFTVASTYSGANIDLSGNVSGTPMRVRYGGVMSTYANGNITSNIISGTTYYVQSIASGTTLTISATPSGPPIQLFNATGPASGAQTMNATVTTNFTITVNNTNSLVVNDAIIFTGNVFGNITANVPYYISSIDTGNSQITISDTRYNGIAGQIKPLTTASGSMTATSIQGTNIWKRLQLNSW